MPISKWNYILPWVGGVAAGMVLLMAGIISGSAIPATAPEQPHILSIALTLAGYLAFALAAWTLLRFVYAMWSRLPASYARTTPARAAGFLLIPVFHLYWVFQAFYGFAKDCNRLLADRHAGVRLPAGLFLVFCEFVALALLGTAAVLLAPFLSMGRAIAAVTFALVAISAILVVFIISVVCDALAIEAKTEQAVAGR